MSLHTSPVPVEFVFNPEWWYRQYGVCFDKSFYLDKRRRIETDLLMSRSLFERFGVGSCPAVPRPILGSMYVAGGFVIPALFGAEICFTESQPPYAVPLELTREEILRLQVPDLRNTWPLDILLDQANELTTDFGYVLGDVNTDGVLNTAVCLRGQQLFLDFYDDPEMVSHLFRTVSSTIALVAETIKSVTGSSSISVNRSVLNVDPTIFLHANCSLQMISPDLYQEQLLPWDTYLSGRLRPYGIHHCGSNFHLFAKFYSQLAARFFDIGWGSDIRAARKELPDAFLNLRLSPTRMLMEPPEIVTQDVQRMIDQAAAAGKTGVCCINMDAGTPDRNVLAVLQAAGH